MPRPQYLESQLWPLNSPHIPQISPDAKEIARAIHVMMTEMNTAFFTPFYHYTPGIWKQHKKLVMGKINYLRGKCAEILQIRREQMKMASGFPGYSLRIFKNSRN
eukprot:sb/3477991/